MKEKDIIIIIYYILYIYILISTLSPIHTHTSIFACFSMFVRIRGVVKVEVCLG